MELQKIPAPISVNRTKTIWRIKGKEFTFPAPQQEPDRWIYLPEKARPVVHFCNKHIKHIKGDLAGEQYLLMPWLLAYVCELFGWVDKETGLRRYMESYAEVGRKNSKTLTNAMLGLAAISVLAPKGGAEAYFLASTEKQAGIALGMVKDQIALSEKMAKEGYDTKLHDYFEPKPSLFRIESKHSNSFIEALAGTAHGRTGGNPSFVIADEVHEIRNYKLLTALRTGMVSRGESLFNMISTAGDDTAAAGYQEHRYAMKLIEGSALSDRYMPLIFAASPDDDPHSPKTWAKANPGLGESVKVDQLKAIHDKAWAMHTGAKTDTAEDLGDDAVTWDEFLRFHLNIWTVKASSFISIKAWQDCKDEILLKNFEKKRAFSGLDLSESGDMNAFVLDFPEYYEELEETEEGLEVTMRLSLTVIPWFWACEESAEKSENSDFPYRNFVAHGLEITPGDTSHQDLIEKRIVAILKRVKHEENGFDPYNAAGISQRLQDKHKIKVIKIKQSFENLNEPTKLFRDLVSRRDFHHDGNAILEWNLKNAVVIKDRTKKKIMLAKESSEKKIDGLAASINGLRLIIDSPIPVKKSVYESRGMRTL